MKAFGIICISKEDFNSPRRARKQLLYEALARNINVKEILYVSAHRHWWQTSAKTISFDRKIKVVQETFLLPGERFAMIRGINRWHIYKKLRPKIIKNHPWHIIFYNPLDVALAEKLRSYGSVIFDWTEDWANYYQDENFKKHQIKAIQRADRVIAVTEGLVSIAKQLCDDPGKVLFLPNASAWRMADNQTPIKDQKEAVSPQIGFIGHLGPWIDIELIEQLAQAEPQWKWVIIGRVGKIERDRLAAIGNISLLGERPFKELQGLAAQCRILVAPYRKGFSGDSTKLYDYLTLNLPIVCSDIETARRLGPCVRIATGLEGWLRAIREGLSGGVSTQTSNLNEACEHTWIRRSEILVEWLSNNNQCQKT